MEVFKIMNDYPSRIVVGISPHQEVYKLQEDQLLLQFNPKLDDAQIEKFLRSHKFKTGPPEAKPRNADTLQAAKMRWIFLPDVAESLINIANDLLLKNREIAVITPIYYAEDQGPESAASPIPDVLVVRLRNPEDNKTLNYLAEKYGLIHNDQMSDLLKPFHYFRLKHLKETKKSSSISIFDLLDQIANLPGVELAELDWLKLDTYHLIPTDTLWANQWNMARINLVDAWDIQTGDNNVWIAVIDSGFDLSHPDLIFTPNTAPTFTHFNAEEYIAGNSPPYNAGPSGVPHGTACCGLAAATVNNAIGVAGVAGGCSIMPVRLGTVPSADRVAAGINWAVANGARIGSLSLTTVATTVAVNAVTAAWTAGMILCAATGNGGGNTTSPPIGFPANHANTIAVGATDQADERKRPASADGECWGSQFGPEIDVVAPGVLCWSTDEQGNNGYNNNNGGPISSWACVNYPSSGDSAGDYIAIFNGTSAATPHVAGLAALLFSQYTGLTNQQVRDIIERTCAKVNPGIYTYANDPNHPNGRWHQEMGYGRIDCNAALRYADLVIADHDLDTGTVPSSKLVGGIWQPKDFWKYQPYVTTTDQPAALPADHEPAKANQDNYVHALVTNLGPATANNIQITWHIMDYPNTELIWPTDWNIGNQIASTTIESLAPGASTAVQAVWPQSLVNIASAYAHPCMVVQAICNQDIGGDLSNRVYEYNNIAQHNISFASFSSPSTLQSRTFTLPFAIGHAMSSARRAELLFDLRKAKGARVYFDPNPDNDLPYIDRMQKTMLRHLPKIPATVGCKVTAVSDTKLLLDCYGCKMEVSLKAGSDIRLLCSGLSLAVSLEDLKVKGAIRTIRGGREQLLLHGESTSVKLPLLEGQVVPMSVTLEAPEDAKPGTHFVVNITQLSDGVATGGLSLDIEAK
jgi:subtilisin family serine protease